MRELDEPIPPLEDLFRRVSADQVSCGIVQSNAVRLPAVSVNRSKYADGRSVLTRESSQFNGVAALRGERLLETHPSPNGIMYEVYCLDDPLEHNVAHANVLVGRVDDKRQRQGHKPSSKAFCEVLKTAIARSMHILIAPRAL